MKSGCWWKEIPFGDPEVEPGSGPGSGVPENGRKGAFVAIVIRQILLGWRKSERRKLFVSLRCAIIARRKAHQYDLVLLEWQGEAGRSEFNELSLCESCEITAVVTEAARITPVGSRHCRRKWRRGEEK